MNKLISMRFEDKFLKKVDEFVKESTYSGRTEVFRAGVRKLIEEWETKQALRMLKNNFGKGKREGSKELTQKEFAKIREAVGKESLSEVNRL